MPSKQTFLDGTLGHIGVTLVTFLGSTFGWGSHPPCAALPWPQNLFIRARPADGSLEQM